MTEKVINKPVCDPTDLSTWSLKLDDPDVIYPITGAVDETDPKAKVFLMNEKKGLVSGCFTFR